MPGLVTRALYTQYSIHCLLYTRYQSWALHVLIGSNFKRVPWKDIIIFFILQMGKWRQREINICSRLIRGKAGIYCWPWSSHGHPLSYAATNRKREKLTEGRLHTYEAYTSPRCPLHVSCVISYVLYPRHHWSSLSHKKEILQYSQTQSYRSKEIILLMQEAPGLSLWWVHQLPLLLVDIPLSSSCISSLQHTSRIFSPIALSSFCLPIGWLLQPQTASHRLICCNTQPLLFWCAGARAASSCAPFTL